MAFFRTATRRGLGLAGTVAVMFGVKDSLVDLQLVKGRSMQPTLNPDNETNAVVVSKLVRSVRRGDVVTFR